MAASDSGSSIDRALNRSAVSVSVMSLICLALAVGLGLVGLTVPLFTYIAMIGFPVAFLLLVAMLLRAIGRRRRT